MFFRPRPNDVDDRHMMTTYEYWVQRRVLFLYGEIHNWHVRSDVFGTHHLEDIMLALASESTDPIWLVINSGGGSIDDGLKLIDTMDLLPAPVYTVGKNCYSMGAIILACGEPGHRYIYPQTKTMLHLPASVFRGTSAETKIQQAEMEKTQDEMINLLIARGVNKSYDEIYKDIDRDYWLRAEESVAYGLVDKVMDKDTLKLMLK